LILIYLKTSSKALNALLNNAEFTITREIFLGHTNCGGLNETITSQVVVNALRAPLTFSPSQEQFQWSVIQFHIATTKYSVRPGKRMDWDGMEYTRRRVEWIGIIEIDTLEYQ
jgi:hypothetical protein